ncbi:Sodium/hydrogen exchanger 9B2 [Frankliniella fusca]|uniref:Sodium/hydrogen exchanger 9B2 n=1 Tax=Frankliniella fusca TaxID=407009 RepID=A0AAE1GZU6_9NEOP|nr:Sodium/hydrogen exchanger 9B2 [Frankliniella fusca]
MTAGVTTTTTAATTAATARPAGRGAGPGPGPGPGPGGTGAAAAGRRVRKLGLPRLQLGLHVEPAALLQHQRELRQLASGPLSADLQPPQTLPDPGARGRGQRRSRPRRPTPAPVFQTPPVRADSPTSTYTVKRFLVIKYEADDNGALPPPLNTSSGAPATGSVTMEEPQPPPPPQGETPASVLNPTYERTADRVADYVASNGGLSASAPAPAHSKHAPKKQLRRGSMHPSAHNGAQQADSGTTFPEDEHGDKCCFTIMCGKWMHCLGSSLRGMLAHPLCPSKAWLARYFAMIMIGILFLGTAILVIGGNGWFQIISAVVVAQLVGIFLNKATSLPPLLGMLLVGVCVRQLGYIEYFSARHEALIYLARSWALVTLMLRTGFHLDAGGARRPSPMMLGLAIIPGLVEFACTAALAVWVLDMPVQFALLSGIIMAAACPSILMPCFSMMGAGRSVQAVLVAVTCLNDMIVIVAFGIVMAIIFSFAGDTLPYVLLHRIMGVGCGLLLGIVCGVFIRYVPDRFDPQVMTIRSLMMGSVGLFSMLGFAKIGFFGGGPAACIVAAWVASRGWRTQSEDSDDRGNPVATVFDVMWRIMQPVMFCLIGADLEISKTSYTMEKLLWSVGVLLVVWLVRIVVSIAVTAYGDLSIKERLYVTLAWVPKAGVQAALCPLALDQARYRRDTGDILRQSRDVMLFVLLAVVITAPLSAALLSRRGLVNVLLPSRRPSTVSRQGLQQQQLQPQPQA